MPLFLKRILQSFKIGSKKNKDSTEKPLSPVASSTVVDPSSSVVPSLTSLSNSTISSVLTESDLYKDGLVHIDALYESSTQGDDQFFCTWNEVINNKAALDSNAKIIIAKEFDRVHERSHFALESLTRRVDDLSQDICIIVCKDIQRNGYAVILIFDMHSLYIGISAHKLKQAILAAISAVHCTVSGGMASHSRAAEIETKTESAIGIYQ